MDVLEQAIFGNKSDEESLYLAESTEKEPEQMSPEPDVDMDEEVSEFDEYVGGRIFGDDGDDLFDDNIFSDEDDFSDSSDDDDDDIGFDDMLTFDDDDEDEDMSSGRLRLNTSKKSGKYSKEEPIVYHYGPGI